MTSSYLFWWWRARRQGNHLLRPATPRQRIAASTAALLILVIAVGGVFLVLTTRSAAVAQARRDAATTHPVTATVLADDDPADAALSRAAAPTGRTVRLGWSWHGSRHTEDKTTMSSTLAPGATTTVWVDDSGAPVSPPWTALDITLVVAGVSLSAAIVVVIAAVAAARDLRAWNLRRQAESWAAEWAVVAPLWSRDHGFR